MEREEYRVESAIEKEEAGECGEKRKRNDGGDPTHFRSCIVRCLDIDSYPDAAQVRQDATHESRMELWFGDDHEHKLH